MPKGVEHLARHYSVAELRRVLSEVAGRPMVVQRDASPAAVRFAARPDVASLATRGPLTPDHVIRTKRVALVGRDVAGYAAEYEAYVERNRHRARTDLTSLDPAPRVVVDPDLGVLSAGPTVADARIAGDIYRHTIPPNASTPARSAARWASASVTSATTGSQPGADDTSATEGDTSTATTHAPSASSRSAQARPIPDAAPVTTPTIPVNRGGVPLLASLACQE